MIENKANPPGNPEALVKFNWGKNGYSISPANRRSLSRLKGGLKKIIVPANFKKNS